jgi:hypothetical protein
MVRHSHESSFTTPYRASLRPETDERRRNNPVAVASLGAATAIWTATTRAAATQNACGNATTKLAAPACRHGMPGLTIAMP